MRVHPETMDRISKGIQQIENQAANTMGRSRRRQVSGGTTVKQLRLKEVKDDYLVCRTWDGTKEGTTDVFVAKPYLLRRTPFDGVSITHPYFTTEVIFTYSYYDSSPTLRKVACSYGDTLDEYQRIVPAYILSSESYDGDIIYATQAQGGTDVVTDTDDGSKDVTLVDVNVDARAYGEWNRGPGEGL